MANYAYLRASTDVQALTHQRYGILEYCNHHSLTALTFIEETVSGTKSWKDRRIGTLVNQELLKGDTLVIAEISRLARSTLQVLEILETCAQKGINVHIAKQNLIFTEQGNMTSTIMATVLGMVAQIEREFISLRTIEALAAKKAAGVRLGRPPGRLQKVKLDQRADEIKAYLCKGVSKRSIARIVDCAPSTLYDWLKRRNVDFKRQIR
jgi:DNA invertase Pin-like site-specific DNA recombinase